MNLRIENIDPQGDVALALLREAAIEIQPLYHDGSVETPPLPENLPLGPRDVYTAVWLEAKPVACGALRELDRSTAEVQRMYVRREYRRRNIGKRILLHLESEAKRLGYTRLLLETGNRQVPAMALYEGSGFRRVLPFGRHADDPTSVCYERHL
jgi:GNAT superfamily N-acetyltransferase